MSNKFRAIRKNIAKRNLQSLKIDIINGIVVNASYAATCGKLHTSFLDAVQKQVAEVIKSKQTTEQMFISAMVTARIVMETMDPFTGELVASVTEESKT